MNETATAIITGGSRGLGAAIALKLSCEGYRVVLNYQNSEASAISVATMAEGPDMMIMKADVSSLEDVERMAYTVQRAWGRVDLLVNNAGICDDALLVRTSEQSWDRIMDVNLKGAFNMTRAFAPLIRSSGGGHVVNISSRSGLRGKAGQSAYSASKAALMGLTVSAARELGPEGIRVNAILPGYMPTDMGSASSEAMEAARRQSLLGSLGSTDDVASFIHWLAGTSTVTGQVFSLDSRAW